MVKQPNLARYIPDSGADRIFMLSKFLLFLDILRVKEHETYSVLKNLVVEKKAQINKISKKQFAQNNTIRSKKVS